MKCLTVIILGIIKWNTLYPIRETPTARRKFDFILKLWYTKMGWNKPGLGAENKPASKPTRKI